MGVHLPPQRLPLENECAEIGTDEDAYYDVPVVVHRKPMERVLAMQ